MLDGCTYGKHGTTIINFLVKCPKGTMFIKFVDASTYVKDAQLLCELLEGFIQVITDNVVDYVVAGKLLMQRYQPLYLTSLC
jgi:hypothetical protein